MGDESGEGVLRVHVELEPLAGSYVDMPTGYPLTRHDRGGQTPPCFVCEDIPPRGTPPPSTVRPPTLAVAVEALVGSVQEGLAKLAGANPQTKAELYRHLGITLSYHPEGRVLVEARPQVPCTYERVGGGT
jgi:hypothetical protein